MAKTFLFDLIKSLDSGEKTYFLQRSKANRSGEASQYLALFKLIDAAYKYNEAEIVQKMVEPGMIKKENFAEAKQFLYETLMRRLRQYHSQKNGSIKLQEYRTDISLLMEKGLWEQARKTIQKAKRIAQRGGLKLYDLEFALLERRITLQLANNAADALPPMQKKCNFLMKQMKNELKIMQLYEQLFLNVTSDNVIKTEWEGMPDKIKRILGDNHDTYLAQASFDSKTHYYSLLGMYFRLKKEYEPSKNNLETLLHIFETAEGALHEMEYQERYLGALNNYFNACFEQDTLTTHYESIISRIQKIPVLNYNLEVRRFYIENYIKILYYFSKSQYHKVVKLADFIKNRLAYYGSDVIQSRRIAFIYYIAVAHFMTKQYAKALVELNQIIKDKEFEVRRDIQLFARMLRILIYFTNGDYAVMRLAVRAFNQHVKWHKKEDTMAAKVVNRIAPIAKMDFKTQQAALRNFRVEIKDEQQYEEIRTWLDRHIL
jgi:hypothetical protein